MSYRLLGCLVVVSLVLAVNTGARAQPPAGAVPERVDYGADAETAGWPYGGGFLPPWAAYGPGHPLLFQKAGTPEHEPDVRQIFVDPHEGHGCGDAGCSGQCGHPRYDLCQTGDCGGDGLGGINVYSWLDQGFTWNPDSPKDRFNGPVTFNDRSNEYQLNQLYLVMERAVCADGCQWDVGGRVDLLYGTDYFFVESTGLETRDDNSPRWNSSDGPRADGAALYGLAMPQLYAEVYAPWGGGLSVKMGHFYTILGYESPMAVENFFYSHSYLKQYAEPFTHTGLLARYDFSPCFHLFGGFTRGWNTWEDNNDKLGFLGGLSWDSPDGCTSVAFTLHTGNEDESGENDRSAYSLLLSHKLSRCVTYVFQHDLGVEANAELDNELNNDDAVWYGIANYIFYKLSPTTDFGFRVEWFRDQDNARVLGVPVRAVVDGGNYVELTVGFNWHPSPLVRFRPELRWDRSDVTAPTLDVEGMFDDFQDKDQITAAVDMILTF